MITDVLLMKRHNINAVRTSHYPDDPRWMTCAIVMEFIWSMNAIWKRTASIISRPPTIPARIPRGKMRASIA